MALKMDDRQVSLSFSSYSLSCKLPLEPPLRLASIGRISQAFGPASHADDVIEPHAVGQKAEMSGNQLWRILQLHSPMESASVFSTGTLHKLNGTLNLQSSRKSEHSFYTILGRPYMSLFFQPFAQSFEALPSLRTKINHQHTLPTPWKFSPS